ncbi:PLP-dependent aminotransferase family protein [Pseudohalocynthiibacter aestuariivivens]|jgi:GntR family transcriptional regulator / MocR family aminotransferase|uniref:PLP-dependent aminotransferase family protein n=1 Tax=Pseudohalocynthiibacter aestuariivivens TaxID=1591409 RepID=A0ABV5JHZ5_9RHOB|nr:MULTISPECIES: PLP-dependent aminotransferase family protein [Pseudohalocynthiibacter]MBS9717379.1 PLP-dependent aminotransferase family protein [Pseudohalocynthiibacter aestuariivivens]MCK0102287.1 PLP-dependent aminotransferase family protein [Pseudohalocynthiibacter sp. F2068]
MAISEETFFLENRFEGTLQSQIQQMVAEGILSGRFRPGEKMPSSRKLAKHLGVSRLTVTLAYNELISDDYLTSHGRSGYFISQSAPPPPEFSAGHSRDSVDWSRAIGRRFSGARLVEKPVDWEAFPYPFVYGQADPTLFDQQNWRLCALQALGRKDFSSLTADYAERDDPKLVEFIARHTLPRRGILARPEEILITIGAQNALWLAAQILLTQRRTAAYENPCYPGLREILTQARCHLAPIPVDDDGLPPDLLPDETDVVFTTPSHQCPTSTTMSLKRRQTLLERARERDFLVVEDDYEFEMSFLTKASPALKSLDEDGRVIYVGSFSKSLFPGLRLGYLVGSAPFIQEARALRSSVLRHIPGHTQRTTAYFLSHGHYDALVRRIRNALHERRELMDQEIRKHGLSIAGRASFGGSSFWMSTGPGIDVDDLTTRLKARGVLIEPGTPFFETADEGREYFRLAYSSIPLAKIPKGIAILAEEMGR